jgi:hypothetical protein
MSRFLSRFNAISLNTYSINQMATKRKASAKKQANRADNEENRVLQWVKSEPPRAIELGTLLSVLTKGWDWSKAIAVITDTSNGQKHFKQVPINSPIKINTSKGRLYGEFFEEDESPVACILEGFEYPPEKPSKDGPSGFGVIEGKGPFFTLQARIHDPNEPTALLKAGKLAKTVVIGSTAYQYAAITLTKKASGSEFYTGNVCFANELPDRILPTQKDRFKCFCIWLNQWWGKHVDEIIKNNHDKRKQLEGECYNPEGIDLWEKQCEALMKLVAKDFPNLFAAWEKLKSAKKEPSRKDAGEEVRLAFIVDWKAVTGKPPSWVDDHGFSKDDVFIKHLYEATKGDGHSKTGKIKWWLANNWIGKKLFIMKPKQLAECYFQETGQRVTGETLARYSRAMGLKNMSKQGPAGSTKK